MRVLNKEDYEKLARDIVGRFVNDRVPLAASLAKTAEDMGLNPDQIRALVQVANTLAHLDLFDRKADGDKVVAFEPADPKDVLERVYQSEDSGCSSCNSGSLSDFFGDLPKPSAFKDVGAPAAPSADSAAGSSPRHQQIMIIKIRKVAEELRHRKQAAALEYEETLSKLASEFAKLYGPRYEEFEKDAVDVHGADSIPVLSDLRKCLRLPQIKLAVFEKTARVVDTDTHEMKNFGRLVSLVEEAKACDAGCNLLQRQIGGLL